MVSRTRSENSVSRLKQGTQSVSSGSAPPVPLTPAQRKRLTWMAASKDGSDWAPTNGLGKTSWLLMMKKLEERGLVKRGRYLSQVLITDAGRAALAQGDSAR